MISRRLQIALLVLVLVILGMTFYALHLKQKAERLQAASENAAPVAAPPEGPQGTSKVFVAYDKDLTIRQEQLAVPVRADASEQARIVLHELLTRYQSKTSSHTIGTGSDVKAVYVVNDVAVIDLNSTFADTHRSGVMEEQLSLVSIAETAAAALPKVNKIRFLIDGHERETLAGHVDLQQVYDVALIAQAAKELQ